MQIMMRIQDFITALTVIIFLELAFGMYSQTGKSIKQSFKRRLEQIHMTHRVPYSPIEDVRKVIPGVFGMLSALSLPSISRALVRDDPIGNIAYQKGLWNAPSDDFWYPPYLVGRWNATMKFSGAKFTPSVPLDILAQNENLPGFTKYSVFAIPDIGKDIENVTLRWAQIDSHPREDHPFNIRSLVQAFCPNTTIDSAPYSFQKAPDWFHSPANRWNIKYHDNTGEGDVELYTMKRNISVFADTVETIEYIRQVIVFFLCLRIINTVH